MEFFPAAARKASLWRSSRAVPSSSLPPRGHDGPGATVDWPDVPASVLAAPHPFVLIRGVLALIKPERRSENRERSAAVLSRSGLGGRAAGKLLDRSAVLKPLRLRTAALRPSGYFGIRVQPEFRNRKPRISRMTRRGRGGGISRLEKIEHAWLPATCFSSVKSVVQLRFSG